MRRTSIFCSQVSKLFFRLLLAVFAVAIATLPSRADVTGTWTVAATTASTSVRGITLQQSGAPGAAAYSNNTLAATTFWSNPYSGTVSGASSVAFTIGTTGATFTFSEPVDNPVLHIDRLGGNNGGANSSIWTLTGSTSQGGSVTLTRLSGNTAFTLTGSTFRRADIGTAEGGTECVTTGITAACGSVQFNGTGITSLTLAAPMSANVGAGDGVELAWSFVGSNVLVRKQSTGGTGSFSFTGTNGVPTTAFALNTATTNPISSSTFAVTNHAAAVTITEAATTGFQITSANCQDAGGATVASSLAGSTLTVAAAAYGGNQTITCTFLNGVVADLVITKTNTPASGHPIRPVIRSLPEHKRPIRSLLPTMVPGRSSGRSCETRLPPRSTVRQEIPCHVRVRLVFVLVPTRLVVSLALRVLRSAPWARVRRQPFHSSVWCNSRGEIRPASGGCFKTPAPCLAAVYRANRGSLSPNQCPRP